jgi:hydroxycarboxylate dehydrogenase B
MKLGILKAQRQGVAVVALKNSGHLGRIGDWAEMGAAANLVSLHFVNTSGGGILVAPFGGTQRRLSANPIAAGVPVKNGPPIIVDISTCTIAEGKIKVAFNKGVKVPEDCILDSDGRPTDDPKAFYATPPGAILPLGGHKGYGLSVIAEVLAGALTGGACSHFGVDRVANNMLSIILGPAIFQRADGFSAEILGLIDHVKSSRTVTPDGEILMPGEPEARSRARKMRDGIEIDLTTWGQIVATAESLGVPIEPLAP